MVSKMTGERIILAFAIILIMLTVFPLPASAAPKIAIVPAKIVKNPGEEFTIKINVATVTNLNLWDIKLSYDPALLDVISVTEGPFLKAKGPTSFGYALGANYISIFCLLTDPVGATGTGDLASVTFQVMDTGQCDLILYETKLVDPDLVEMSHTTGNSFVYTEYPVACFTISPDHPNTGETVTFNASCSFAPGGGNITDYAWDLGDGTKLHGNATIAKVVTHAYAGVNQTYGINLTITVMPPPPPGDVDGDLDVDSTDLFKLAPAYGSKIGDPLYNANCDFDKDGDVDSVDLFTLAPNYGKKTVARKNIQLAWIYVTGFT